MLISLSTLQFPIADEHGNEGWWQRILDEQGVLPKTMFKKGWKSQGHAWLTPNTNYIESKEIWITEGIFDTIALWLSDITSFSCLSAGTGYYPYIFLNLIKEKCIAANKPLPKLVWAFDNDKAGHDGIFHNIERAIADGFECEAALPPSGRKKVDWNDLYKQDRLKLSDLENYKYYGALLIAPKPVDKALLIYKRNGTKTFPFDFLNQVYWFKLDNDKYDEYLKDIGFEDEDNEDWLEEEKEKALADRRDKALHAAANVTKIINCKPTALYYQYSEETDEAWYYFNVDFPRNQISVKNTFTGSQLAAASEFKKRLLAVAPGVVYTGKAPTHKESVLNHSAKPELFAINFAHLYRVAADYRYSLPEMNELQNALRHSLHYRFVEANKAIQSKISGSTKRCWIFEKPMAQRD